MKTKKIITAVLTAALILVCVLSLFGCNNEAKREYEEFSSWVKSYRLIRTGMSEGDVAKLLGEYNKVSFNSTAPYVHEMKAYTWVFEGRTIADEILVVFCDGEVLYKQLGIGQTPLINPAEGKVEFRTITEEE